MKKLAAILLVSIFAVSFAFSWEGDTKTASAEFQCKVIEPLSWDTPADVILEEVIAGYTRDITDVDVVFTLHGEKAYNVAINTSGTTANSGNPSGDVSLEGTWDASTTVLDASGSLTVKYTCDKIVSANSTDATGDYSFTISVDAQYTGL